MAGVDGLCILWPMVWPGRVRRWIIALACVAAALPTGGCATRVPADPARLTTPTPSISVAWPRRDEGWTEKDIVADGSEQTVWFGTVRFTANGWTNGFVSMQAIFHEVVPRGRGVLARASPPGRLPDPPGFRRVSYFFYSSGTDRFPIEVFLGSRPLPLEEGSYVPAQAISPVMFEVTERTDLPGGRRGVALFFHSFGADSYERPIIQSLRNRGWTVVETWFPVGLLFVLEPPQETFATVESAARHFANQVDGALAEWAYGCEALLEELTASDPGVAARPIVIVGCSAGGLGAPVAAARLREGGRRIAAAVLVGAGADLSRVVHTSDLFVGGKDGVLLPGRPLAGETLERLSAEYLRRSRLDPYHTAAALRDVPVLMLHARDDRIVPAPTGDLLYERLGRPERWTLPMGHELMFWRLPAYAGEIADWVDRAVQDEPAAEQSAGSGPLSR